MSLGDSYGNNVYAYYSSFSIGTEESKYVLSVSGYSGTAGNLSTVLFVAEHQVFDW